MTTEFELVLDAGHGGKDGGANKADRREKFYTLMITLYEYKRFKELGVDVGLTRDNDKELEPDVRTALARKGKYCISNHLNAGGADRAEVIHSIYNDGKLANLIKNELIEVGQNDVKVYSRKGSNGDYYFMQRETGSTVTLIVEYCFIDNDKDFTDFYNKWQQYCEAVIKAYCEYTGRKYFAPKTNIASDARYRVIAGSFKDKNNAEKLVGKLKAEGYESYIEVK